MSDIRPPVAIVPAEGPDDMARVRDLFLEYQTWLGLDLCFQGFEEELATLPGRYAPPGGGLWFAKRSDEIAGVVGLRPLEGGQEDAQEDRGRCELKRLWVRPGHRGLALGRRLTETAITMARAAGYRSLWLDTLPLMTDARRLYDELGFREAAPYYHNPVEGVVYMQLDLSRDVARTG